MFNYFKKQPVIVIEPEVAVKEIAPAPKRKYPPVVEKIHREFDTASDRLLKEAEVFMQEAKKVPMKKIQRLKSLGFGKTREVETATPVIQKADLSNLQKKLIMDYKVSYPAYKFIAESQVEEICKKYNLVCGETSRYFGFVPEKNLAEIESFSGLRSKDVVNIEVMSTCIYHGVVGYISKNDLPDYVWSEFSSYLAASGVPSDNADAPVIHDLIEISRSRQERREDIGGVFLQYREFDTSEFLICAPVKDMDLKGMELQDGYKMIKHIPDPVVLQRIRGGYLIITAWGDEASDPIVVNEGMN